MRRLVFSHIINICFVSYALRMLAWTRVCVCVPPLSLTQSRAPLRPPPSSPVPYRAYATALIAQF